jgi:hypothetical protein
MRLHKALALVIGMTYLSAQTACAAEIEGVHFAEHYQWQETQLRLNGVGLLRYRLFIKGYAAALYLGEQVAPERVLDEVPRRLEIEYFWSIPAEAFSEAMFEGVARNVDADTLRRLREPMQRFSALYEDVEPGDRYALTYIPGVGTELALNGERKGLVEGDDFSSALFSIWLGERAFDAALRERLLTEG